MTTKKGGARPKTRPNDERGGARAGAGRPGQVAAQSRINLAAYPEAQRQLAQLTQFRRRTGSPRISQPAIVAALIAAEVERLGLAPDIEIGPGPTGLIEEGANE